MIRKVQVCEWSVNFKRCSFLHENLQEYWIWQLLEDQASVTWAILSQSKVNSGKANRLRLFLLNPGSTCTFIKFSGSNQQRMSNECSIYVNQDMNQCTKEWMSLVFDVLFSDYLLLIIVMNQGWRSVKKKVVEWPMTSCSLYSRELLAWNSVQRKGTVWSMTSCSRSFIRKDLLFHR